jgi:hypothetical protein
MFFEKVERIGQDQPRDVSGSPRPELEPKAQSNVQTERKRRPFGRRDQRVDGVRNIF